MPFLRRRGFFGYNVSPRSAGAVLPADLTIVGVMGVGARQIDAVQLITSPAEVPYKIGPYRSGYNLRYCIDSFYKNVRGQSAKLYVKTYTPNDAVQAFSNAVDTQATYANTLKIASGLGNGVSSLIDKSADGNSTGYTLIKGARFTTAVASNALVSATSLVLNSVSDIQIGDLLRITSSGPTVHYTKVSAVNAATNTVTVTALTNAATVADSVDAMGFQITTYRKNQFGQPIRQILTEDKIFLSMEPENVQYYVGNAFVNHQWLSLTDLSDPATLFARWPADVTTVTYLTSGSDGTAPSTSSDWLNEPADFDSYPIRWLMNTESTLSSVNTNGESYCTSRLDAPIWMYNLPALQSYTQLITIGNGYQRSNQVQGMAIASQRNWTDPIGVGPNPVRSIPTHMAIVGTWIFTIYTAGVHRAPAGPQFPIIGFQPTPAATEDTFTPDQLTLVEGAGINLLQQIPGQGLVLQTFRTPSTNPALIWGHWLIMQNFLKISIVESLGLFQNAPHTYRNLTKYVGLVKDFGRKLFEGSFPFGVDRENGFFGDVANPTNGVNTQLIDVFQVEADAFNNPFTDLLAGDGTMAVFFFGQPLLESFAIQTGVLIP